MELSQLSNVFVIRTNRDLHRGCVQGRTDISGMINEFLSSLAVRPQLRTIAIILPIPTAS